MKIGYGARSLSIPFLRLPAVNHPGGRPATSRGAASILVTEACGKRGWNGVAARLGLEPRQTDSESVVLPLHHRAVKPFRPDQPARRGRTSAGRRCLGSVKRRRRRMEPAMGLEPATPCLQNRCSAIELRRRVSPTIGNGNVNNNCAAPDPGSRSRDWWLPGDSNPEPTD